MERNNLLNLWLNSEYVDEDLKKELKNLNDEEEICDRFYKDLEFGTGGLRGIMGAGTNRMNTLTVAKATQGFANYLNKNFENPSVAIGYDCRNNSESFAKITALTFAANGVKAYLYKELEPTPIVSYATRKLNCAGGVVVTASHNKKEYNGYKAYDEFGCQLTDEKANIVIDEVNKILDFKDIKRIDEEEALNQGLFNYIEDDFLDSYFELVKNLVIRKDLVSEKAKDFKIIYSPLHGAGNVPIRRVLKELGYENVHVVKEQELPNGDFPTLVQPNPEYKEAFVLALEMAKDMKPDIIFATDPDSDRIGVVSKNLNGEYEVLTGNQTGLLLTNYILESLASEKKLTGDEFIVKTIVTTNATTEVANFYNVELLDVLTGFKYIGEKIRELSDLKGRKFLFGFEESYGCLVGDFVRDKDAVIASVLITEMALYYKEKNMTLFEALDEIYQKFGFFKEDVESIELEGSVGLEKINKCMEALRSNKFESIFNKKILAISDYKTSYKKNFINNSEEVINLPKSNVIKFELEDKYSFIVRPSGTEPKLKIYFSIREEKEKDLENIDGFKKDIMTLIEGLI